MWELNFPENVQLAGKSSYNRPPRIGELRTVRNRKFHCPPSSFFVSVDYGAEIFRPTVKIDLINSICHFQTPALIIVEACIAHLGAHENLSATILFKELRRLEVVHRCFKHTRAIALRLVGPHMIVSPAAAVALTHRLLNVRPSTALPDSMV